MAIKLEVVTRRDNVTFGYGQIDTKLMARNALSEYSTYCMQDTVVIAWQPHTDTHSGPDVTVTSACPRACPRPSPSPLGPHHLFAVA